MPIFCLLRWVEEETVSVVREDTVKKGMKVYPGAIAEFRWLGKFYEGEVLKVSNNRQELLRDCDKLTNMEITREELLAQTEKVVDSTITDQPPKKKQKKEKSQQKEAKLSAAKGRAKKMFEEVCESNESSALRREIESLKEELRKSKETTDSKAVEEENFSDLGLDFNEDDQAEEPQAHDGYVESEYTGRAKLPLQSSGTREKAAESQSHGNKQPVQSGRPSYGLDSHNSGSKPSGSSVQTSGPKLAASLAASYNHSNPGKQNGSAAKAPKAPGSLGRSGPKAATAPSRPGPGAAKSMQSRGPPSGSVQYQATVTRGNPSVQGEAAVQDAIDPEHGSFKVAAKPIELVTGYGVFLTQKQLNAALDGSRGSPTKLIRNLVGIFFTPDVLAVSSAMGTRKHVALDGDIIEACIRKFCTEEILSISKHSN